MYDLVVYINGRGCFFGVTVHINRGADFDELEKMYGGIEKGEKGRKGDIGAGTFFWGGYFVCLYFLLIRGSNRACGASHAARRDAGPDRIEGNCIAVDRPIP